MDVPVEVLDELRTALDLEAVGWLRQAEVALRRDYDFPDHKGRPGEVGGSLPRDAGEGPSDKGKLDKPSSSYTPSYPAGRDTKDRFSDGRGNYTSERRQLHKTIMEKYLVGTTPVDAPVATIIGGGMGAGKSTLVESEGLIQANTVEVNVDKIRTELPELREALAGLSEGAQGVSVAETHEEASDISRALLVRAAASKRNVVLDGTGDTTLRKLGGKVAELRAAGHRVVATYVTTSVAIAQARADKRAQTTDRRFAPPTALREIHKAVSGILPEAIKQGLFDEVKLWDTSLDFKPRLVMTAKGTNVTVLDKGLWDEFLAKAA